MPAALQSALQTPLKRNEEGFLHKLQTKFLSTPLRARIMRPQLRQCCIHLTHRLEAGLQMAVAQASKLYFSSKLECFFFLDSSSQFWLISRNYHNAGTNKSTLEMEPIPVSTKPSGGGRLSRLWGGGGGNTGTAPASMNLSAGTPASASDLHRREAELQRREADLARREASLAAAGAARKNWPTYLKLVHHDINADIAAPRRGLVRAAYFAWCLVATGYIYNFICMTVFFIGGEKKVSLWVFAGLVAVAGLPLSFLCWYRGLYWAAARDSGVRWGWAILHLLAHIVWCWWMFVGITPDLGGYSAGLFTMIDQFSNGGSEGIAFAVMSIVNMVIFAVCGVLSMGVLAKSWGTLRSGPALPVERVRI